MQKRAFTRERISRVSRGPGVYKLFKKGAKKVTYIGSSGDVRKRLTTWKGKTRYRRFGVVHTDTLKQAREKEKRMIKLNKPRRNKMFL